MNTVYKSKSAKVKYTIYKSSKNKPVIKYNGRNWSLRISPIMKYVTAGLFR